MCRKLCNFPDAFRIVRFSGVCVFSLFAFFSLSFLSSILFPTLHCSNHGSTSHFPDCLSARIVLIGFAPPFPPSLLLCTGLLWPVLCVLWGEWDVAQWMVPFSLCARVWGLWSWWVTFRERSYFGEFFWSVRHFLPYYCPGASFGEELLGRLEYTPPSVGELMGSAFRFFWPIVSNSDGVSCVFSASSIRISHAFALW